MKQFGLKWSKYLVFAAALGISAGATAEQNTKLSKVDGPTAYQNTCFYCHDAGQVGPEIKGRNLPEEYIIVVARNGLKAMPAFPYSHIDEESMALIAKYISESPATDKVEY